MTLVWSIGVRAGVVAVTAGLFCVPALAVGEKGNAELKDRAGKAVGTVKILQTGAGALIRVKIQALPPGPHGFHIHGTGSCDGDFSSTGEIYNPLGAKHGFLSEEGPMAGDLPNIHVGSGGEAEFEFLNQFISLGKDAEEALLDTDGAAFVIFDNADDYSSEPDGNVGASLACGAITPGG